MGSQNLSAQNTLWIDQMDLSVVQQGFNDAKSCTSVNGTPIRIGGQEYPRGVGTHAHSEIAIKLYGEAISFKALVGIDDEVEGRGATVVFEVLVDGKPVWNSGLMQRHEAARVVEINLTGAQELILVTQDGGDGVDMDHADWADAQLLLKNDARHQPHTFKILQPIPNIAKTDRSQLAINGPAVLGTTPGRDFLFRIPASGERPLRFQAINLPKGLVLDPDNGIISGQVEHDGDFIVTLTVYKGKKTASRDLKIIAGKDKLARTPPMGWNSWNCWGLEVSQEKVLETANQFIDSGLADYGYMYVNIDDGWQAGRKACGKIKANDKFPDMKKLADDVHALGLRIGTYSSPGPKTCGGYTGSFEHEFDDVRAWAEWGFDYVKYDYCSYKDVVKGNELKDHIAPYELIRKALDSVDRDIVFSICTGNEFAAWNWGPDLRGNLWRTTSDIIDTWGSMAGIGFWSDSVGDFQRSGAWNDPDMLVVGKVGWSDSLHETRLTKNEQVTHLTLWSILGAPLLIGCDLSQLDEFTFDLLTNSEVIAINQDPLGKQGRRLDKEGYFEVWSRPLEDGSLAVALFNRGPVPGDATFHLAKAELSGKHLLRDLWRKRDLSEVEESYTTQLHPHESLFLRVIPQK